MMRSDRVFGAIVILGALAYIAGAFQIRTGFLSDPLGSKSFPILIGSVAAICGAVMVLRPDPEPDWPGLPTLGNIAVSVLVMVAYAYALKPMGFLIPTAICAGILSFQIHPRALTAAVTGVALSAGLFVLFKYVLGLGLVPVPKGWFG